MNQGGSNRGNRLAVCDSPDRELEAGAINPVILSSASVSNFQFQISPANAPLGRRASTTSGGVTVRHVYDGVHCAADTDSSGTLLRSYTWGPGIDNLLAVTCHSGSSSTTYYALTDIQGTVHGFADAGGNLFETYAYDAWGNVLAVRDASGLPIQNLKSPIGNRYLFQGREYSHATGLYNFRLRWYDSATGRWLSKDPIGISGGLNLYAFCANDPVNYVDPWGLKEEDSPLPEPLYAGDYHRYQMLRHGIYVEVLTDSDLMEALQQYWDDRLSKASKTWNVGGAMDADTYRFHHWHSPLSLDDRLIYNDFRFQYGNGFYHANEVNYIAAGAYVEHTGGPLGVPGLGRLSVTYHNWVENNKLTSPGKAYFYGKGKQLYHSIKKD